MAFRPQSVIHERICELRSYPADWNSPITFPSVSATRAYAPIPGIGVFGVTIFPPAALTFCSVASIDFTPTYTVGFGASFGR